MLELEPLRICVTGGAGFLGRHVMQCLLDRGVPSERILVPRRSEYDLTQASEVARMFKEFGPDVVIHLAAEVGGIGANRAAPGRFFYANIAMGIHLVEQAREAGLRKFIQVGTVCSYPKHCRTPFTEKDLWEGYPEETNAPYGIAKKALYVMLDAYHQQYGLRSAVVIPTNLYGPHDNFDPDSSHVIPALIRKVETAKAQRFSEVSCWGTGNATRDFLYVEDAAEAIVRAAERVEQPTPINLGSSMEITMRDLARQIADILDFRGTFTWDASRPDGQPRRCVNAGRAKELLDWTPRIGLSDGLRRTIEWYGRFASDRRCTD